MSQGSDDSDAALQKDLQAIAKRNVSSYAGMVAAYGEKRVEKAVKQVVKKDVVFDQGFFDVDGDQDIPNAVLQQVKYGVYQFDWGRTKLPPGAARDLSSRLMRLQIQVSETRNSSGKVVRTEMKTVEKTDVEEEVFFSKVAYIREQVSSARSGVPKGFSGKRRKLALDEAGCRAGASSSSTGKRSGKFQEAVDIVANPAKMAGAMDRLAAMVDRSKQERQQESMLSRYTELVKAGLPGKAGSHDSIMAYIAVMQEAGYKTVKSGVDQVLKSTICSCSQEEADDVRRAMETMKRRGFTGRKEQKRPLTMYHVGAWFKNKLVNAREAFVCALAFFLALRKSEVKKLDTTMSRKEGKIHLYKDEGELCCDFATASIKSNLYKVVRIPCVCENLKTVGLPQFFCVACNDQLIKNLKEDDLDLKKIVEKAAPSCAFGSHSFRIGSACSLFELRFSTDHILLHCRWTNLSMLMIYLRNLGTVPRHVFLKIYFCGLGFLK